MAAVSPSLEDVCASVGVDPGLSSSLVQEGWTSETFGLAASDMSGFDAVLDEIFNGKSLTHLQKAQIRAAFRKCQRIAEPQEASHSSKEGLKDSPSTNSWSESFAPKLDSQAIHDMKTQFLP